MTTETTNPSQILEATEGFVCDMDGERIFVNRGITRVAANHPLALAYPNRFRPIEAGMTYPDSETTTAEPGERRARPSRTTKEN